MITLAKIRSQKSEIINLLKKKNFDSKTIIENIEDLDNNRKKVKNNLDITLSNVNVISKNIGILMKEGNKEKAEEEKQKSLSLKNTTDELNARYKSIEEELNNLLVQIPNIPNSIVPEGKSASDNVEIRTFGTKPSLYSNAIPHWDLAKKYNLFDLELGTKLTGAGFPVFKGKGAKLERALINFFLDENQKAGYTEIIPPLMVNEASAFATGQLPDKEGQMYVINDDKNFYLIPTSEVPVTNIYRDTITIESHLPIKMTAYSQCFRREAGSYGKDVRGLNRVHQFDKVEIVQLVKPKDSYNALEQMTIHVESLLQKLGLHYRVLLLCGGDMSFTSSLTYDLEVYSAAQDRWLEVSSVSNFEDYQTNRLKARYKDANGEINLLHSLNGSSLALPRIFAALIENFQTEKGIIIPEILRPYTGFDIID